MAWTDEQIVEFAASFRDGILDGRSSRFMCAAVCWPLCTLLNMYGVKCEAVEVDLGDLNHVFLRLSDGRALDPTADQFNELFPHMNMPPVYLGQPMELHGVAGDR